MEWRLATFLIVAVSALVIAMSSIDALAQGGQNLIGTWEWLSVDNTQPDGT